MTSDAQGIQKTSLSIIYYHFFLIVLFLFSSVQVFCVFSALSLTRKNINIKTRKTLSHQIFSFFFFHFFFLSFSFAVTIFFALSFVSNSFNSCLTSLFNQQCPGETKEFFPLVSNYQGSIPRTQMGKERCEEGRRVGARICLCVVFDKSIWMRVIALPIRVCLWRLYECCVTWFAVHTVHLIIPHKYTLI